MVKKQAPKEPIPANIKTDNMKNLSIIALLILMTGYSGMAQQPGVEQILAKHAGALGYENLRKISTVTMTGMLIQNDAMPVKIVKMRPDRYLMEYDVQDVTTYQAYDGKTAWMTAPWTGNPKPQPVPEERVNDIRSRADFDGLLINPESKGVRVELSGTDTVEKSPAYKMKITKSDGWVEFLFVDAASFLVTKRQYQRMIRGKEVAVDIYFRDFRSVGGIKFPYVQQTFIGGEPYNSIQFEVIETDRTVNEKIFRMP